MNRKGEDTTPSPLMVGIALAVLLLVGAFIVISIRYPQIYDWVNNQFPNFFPPQDQGTVSHEPINGTILYGYLIYETNGRCKINDEGKYHVGSYALKGGQLEYWDEQWVDINNDGKLERQGSLKWINIEEQIATQDQYAKYKIKDALWQVRRDNLILKKITLDNKEYLVDLDDVFGITGLRFIMPNEKGELSVTVPPKGNGEYMLNFKDNHLYWWDDEHDKWYDVESQIAGDTAKPSKSEIKNKLLEIKNKEYKITVDGKEYSSLLDSEANIYFILPQKTGGNHYFALKLGNELLWKAEGGIYSSIENDVGDPSQDAKRKSIFKLFIKQDLQKYCTYYTGK